MITVHITEDEALYLELLPPVLEKSGKVSVTGVSSCIADCCRALAESTPQILILDLGLPDGNGIDFCLELLKQRPALNIIILTTHGEYYIARKLLDSGVKGFLVKNSNSAELLAAIETVVAGDTYVCPLIKQLLNDRRNQQNEIPRITRRESEVLKLLAKGLQYKEIADSLNISYETVVSHVKSMKEKLKADNRTELLNAAQKNMY
jgi:DNA-binding NarL/FixJ family response regulator